MAAVSMLMVLSQLRAVVFGVHSCPGSDLDHDYPDMDDWEHFVHLPPLGGVTALTELWLAGLAALPPDLRQLAHLRRLTVADACTEEGDLEWGNAPMSGLASLTRVELINQFSLPGEKRGKESRFCRPYSSNC